LLRCEAQVVVNRQYTAETLLFRPQKFADDPSLHLSITPQNAGWDFISFQVRRLRAGEQWSFATGDEELALVTLSGLYDVQTNRGEWRSVGGRENVFAGIAHVVYLPRRTDGTVVARMGGEFAVATAPASKDYAPFLVTPQDVTTAIRGGDNATRQINMLIPPGALVERLVLVEVYTPSGSWSSYPPHKHDVHREDANGRLIEADLEEVYFYKIDKPDGYALQHVYTDGVSPLHQQGQPIDAIIRVADSEAVIVPEGYHPVVSPPGYTTYYLNVLAGSAQSLACVDDPRYAWVRDAYQARDGRVPLYPLPREPIYEK
jgi:5-deoxy-glucuronate isomerase